jgi:hypothetical protein
MILTRLTALTYPKRYPFKIFPTKKIRGGYLIHHVNRVNRVKKCLASKEPS